MFDFVLAAESDELRSECVRALVQRRLASIQVPPGTSQAVPRRILQYWDSLDHTPDDVQSCINSWSPLEALGFRRDVFDDSMARRFVRARFAPRHLAAFDRCYHPAMRCDYFRLCYILAVGGCYVDADEEYGGADIRRFFVDNRLKLQPLCYDVSTDLMVDGRVFSQRGMHSPDWIFYFNNNPIIAPPGDQIVAHALERATRILNEAPVETLPEIQSTTGPGNMTASVVANLAVRANRQNGGLRILYEWGSVSTTIWPLSYRSDARNWRLSNGIPFEGPRSADSNQADGSSRR